MSDQGETNGDSFVASEQISGDWGKMTSVQAKEALKFFANSVKNLNKVEEMSDWCSQASARLAVLRRWLAAEAVATSEHVETKLALLLQAQLPLSGAEALQEEELLGLGPEDLVVELKRRFASVEDPFRVWSGLRQGPDEDVMGFGRRFGMALQRTKEELEQFDRIPAPMLRQQFFMALNAPTQEAAVGTWQQQAWTGFETVFQLSRLVGQCVLLRRRLRAASGETGEAPLQARVAQVQGNQTLRCFRCDQVGHFARECPQRECFQCGRKGHEARDCEQRRAVLAKIVDPAVRKEVEAMLSGNAGMVGRPNGGAPTPKQR